MTSIDNSTKNLLGQNIENHEKLVSRVKNVSQQIEKKKTQFENMKSRIDKLTELNNKLTNGYELSMKIVVDVSKLLQNYTKMFDDIEKMLGTLDSDFGIQQNDIKYISELTKESIKKITSDFNNQYSGIVNALEKNGNRESVISAMKLKTIANELPVDAETLQSNINEMKYKKDDKGTFWGGKQKKTHKKFIK